MKEIINRFLFLFILLLLTLSGQLHGNIYTISPGDLLEIRTLGHPEFTVSNLYVLPDGTFYFPGIGAIECAGKNPHELALELEERLEVYVVNPMVTVFIKQIENQRANIYGYVNAPGRYYISEGTDIFAAFGIAGGVVNFRRGTIVKIIRADRSVEEYRVRNYVGADRIVHEVPRLYAGDTMYVREPCYILTDEWRTFLYTIVVTISILTYINNYH